MGCKWFIRFEVDVQYLEKLHELHNDLAFLPERIKIKKFEKLVTNLHDKTESIIHIRNLKQALNNGLVHRVDRVHQVHRVIRFNQNACLKSYIGMNIDLSKKSKQSFEFFFKLMNNAVFGKTMENMTKHRDAKLIKTERRINFLYQNKIIIL